MLTKRKKSLRKNIAILMCVAFVFLFLPDVTHSASSSSSKTPKSTDPLSIYSYYLLISNLTANIVVNGSAYPTITANSDSVKKPKKDD